MFYQFAFHNPTLIKKYIYIYVRNHKQNCNAKCLQGHVIQIIEQFKTQILEEKSLLAPALDVSHALPLPECPPSHHTLQSQPCSELQPLFRCLKLTSFSVVAIENM